MPEELILLLLVPAIVVPVVLLVGFAGCSFCSPTVDETIIEGADGMSTSTIRLTWKGDEAAKFFEFEETNLSNGTTDAFQAVSSPFDRGGLTPKTKFSYRGRAFFDLCDEPGFGAYSDPKEGTTLPVFQSTFEAPLVAQGIDANEMGRCLVQRINAAALSTSGTEVRLTLRGPVSGNCAIERIGISQARPAPADDYDPAGDLTKVPSSAFVLATLEERSFTVAYALDETQALLIAVDFSSEVPPVRYTQVMPPGRAVAFFGPQPEAHEPDRTTGYSERQDRVYLIERIEVG